MSNTYITITCLHTGARNHPQLVAARLLTLYQVSELRARFPSLVGRGQGEGPTRPMCAARVPAISAQGKTRSASERHVPRVRHARTLLPEPELGPLLAFWLGAWLTPRHRRTKASQPPSVQPTICLRNRTMRTTALQPGECAKPGPAATAAPSSRGWRS
jgi:hypothetical protein